MKSFHHSIIDFFVHCSKKFVLLALCIFKSKLLRSNFAIILLLVRTLILDYLSMKSTFYSEQHIDITLFTSELILEDCNF